MNVNEFFKLSDAGCRLVYNEVPLKGQRALSPKEEIRRAQALACNLPEKNTPSCTGQAYLGIFFDGTGSGASAASLFGFPVCWVNRDGGPFDELGATPAFIVPDLAAMADCLFELR